MTAPDPIIGPHSLLQRIRALFALVFIISVVGNALYTAHEQSVETLTQLERNALAETRVIAAGLELSIVDMGEPSPALRAHVPTSSGLLRAALIAPDGQILSSLARDEQNEWSRKPRGETSGIALLEKVPADMRPRALTTTRAGTAPGRDGARKLIVSWVPLASAGSTLWLRTETDAHAADDVWKHILSDSLLHGLIAVLIAIAALHVLLRRPLAALQQCTEFAERLDHSRGDTLSVSTGSRETDRLAEALNWASLSLYDQRSALAESEARTGAIMNAAIDGVITFDCFGNVIEFNPAATRMLGWSTAEAMQRPVIELLVAPEDREAGQTDLLQWLGRRFDAVIGHHLEIEITRRDGTHFPAELAITSTQMKGRALFTAFVSDISERKAAQQQMMQARDAAEAANRAKSDFLANMSHEIRTPMNAVIGLSDLLAETPLAPEQRDYVNTIRTSGDSLLALLNDILDFSKIESGQLEFEHQPFELRHCVESALDLFAPAANRKNLELAACVEPEVPDVLEGDATRVRQILVNLVGNAVKFTAAGEVVVRVRSEPAPDGGLRLRCEVRDTGIGIPPDRRDRLFKLFSQVDSSTSRRFGGTGLGLAICQRLVTGMGGKIWMEPNPGGGSIFSFTLRLSVSAQPLAPAAELPPVWTGRSAWVVDDNATNLLVLTRQLEAAGAAVTAFASGREALAAATGRAVPDFAVLDLHMPDLDGIQLARALRDRPATARVPLILVSSSGSGAPPDGRDLFAAVVPKPVKAHALRRGIDLALGQVPPAARPSALEPALAAGERPLRLLLAEDNPVNQKVALGMLRQLGCTATVVANGHEAVEAARRSSFDAILMDVQMPEMNGIEATRELRRCGTASYIVALTAGVLDGDRAACADAGMDDFLAKPLRLGDLRAALRRIAHERAIRPRAQAIA